MSHDVHIENVMLNDFSHNCLLHNVFYTLTNTNNVQTGDTQDYTFNNYRHYPNTIHHNIILEHLSH